MRRLCGRGLRRLRGLRWLGRCLLFLGGFGGGSPVAGILGCLAGCLAVLGQQVYDSGAAGAVFGKCATAAAGAADAGVLVGGTPVPEFAMPGVLRHASSLPPA